MKSTMKRWFFILMSGTVIAGLLLAALPEAALASTPTQAQTVLQNMLKSSKAQQRHYSNLFTKADKLVTKAQNQILRAQAKGKDTTAIEAALATFQPQLADAKADWMVAQNAIMSHAGFDDTGTMTDEAMARDTTNTIGQSQLSMRSTFDPAYKIFQKAYNKFK